MTGSNIINSSVCNATTKGDVVACKRHGRKSSGGLRIRTNFMNKLGIMPSSPVSSQKDSVPVKSILGSNPNITMEPLNDRNVEDDSKEGESFWDFGSFLSSLRAERRDGPPSAPALASSVRTEDSASSLSGSTRSDGEKRLTFHEQVSVCSIPRREQYSQRIRQHLWPSMEEFSKKAERNTIEFASEGWDWRKSLEREDMYFDVSTGEYIHPIHIMLEKQQQQQQEESKGNDASHLATQP